MTNITVQLEKKDLQFQAKEGVAKAVVNIYGRITSMARRVVNVFERPVTVDALPDCRRRRASDRRFIRTRFRSPPGMYRLNVVVKDVVGGNMNNYEMALNVPQFDDEKLGLEQSDSGRSDRKSSHPEYRNRAVRDRHLEGAATLDDTFRRDEKLGIYLQLYNFAPDEKTQKPNGQIQYEVVKNGSNEKILDFTEDITAITGASANQVTIEKLLPLQSLQPGQYTSTAEGDGQEQKPGSYSICYIYGNLGRQQNAEL